MTESGTTTDTVTCDECGRTFDRWEEGESFYIASTGQMQHFCGNC